MQTKMQEHKGKKSMHFLPIGWEGRAEDVTTKKDGKGTDLVTSGRETTVSWEAAPPSQNLKVWRARQRRHAFGEWNYSSSLGEPQLSPSSDCAAGQASWWYAPEPGDCSDVWFSYSPPHRKSAPKKARGPSHIGE
jgi:hypothetical protein